MLALYIIGGWFVISLPVALIAGHYLQRISAMYPEADDAHR